MTPSPPSMVWVDGRLHPEHAATVSALDRGFRSGEGVFETLRVRDRCTHRLADHLDRLQAGGRRLGIDLDRSAVCEAIAAVVMANDHLGDDLVVRITSTPGPLDLTASFPGVGRGPATLVVTAQRARDPGGPPLPPARGHLVDLRRELADLKSTSYLLAVLAQRRAHRHGSSDAILCDTAGQPLEAATANLMAIAGDVVVTAPLSAGVLAGVTRGAVCELAGPLGLHVEQRVLTRAELLGADEALLTSAVRGVQPLVEVDGHRLGDGMTGPTTARLRGALDAHRHETAEPLPVSGSPAG